MPNIVTTWGLKVDGYLSHDNLLVERYMICAAWKWLDEPGVFSISVLDGPKNKEFPDYGIAKKLGELLASADAVVAHNGDKFDLPWIMSRLVIQGFDPPPPIPIIDTKVIAKKRFYFNSNRLDYLGRVLKLGRKIKTEYDLWLDALKGDRTAIRKMIVYNEQDVRLLEKVYKKLRPYVPAKLNMSLWGQDEKTCPTCGKDTLVANGFGCNRSTRYKKYKCLKCGAYSSKPLGSKVVR